LELLLSAVQENLGTSKRNFDIVLDRCTTLIVVWLIEFNGSSHILR